MNAKLKIINKNLFEASQSTLLFKIDRPRIFAIFKYSHTSFKLAWQSDLIQPEIDNLIDNIYSIGIDLNFAIVDFEKDNIILNLELDYFFYGIELHRGYLYLITELVITRIDLVTYKIHDNIWLPDFFTNMVFTNDHIEITCISGETIQHHL